jgi:hypothetical protein
LGQKNKDTLAFNRSNVAQNVLTSCSSKLLEPHSLYAYHQAQAYKANKQATKNNTPIKRKALKERTKDRLDSRVTQTQETLKTELSSNLS